MSAPDPSSLEARLDDGEAMTHPFTNPAPAHEEEVDHHHGPEEAVRSLLAAASRLSGNGGAFHSGCESIEFPSAREAQLVTLSSEPIARESALPQSFVGGEHVVFIPSSPDVVIKHTLPGFYGRILDERSLLDPRTFLNRKQLAMRGALPSEYLQRWAVMADVFGLATHYLGRTEGPDREPCMAVSQPFIVELPEDPATLDDVAALMEAHGFSRVDPDMIVNPEIKDVTWYRQRDGLLITDAHARNFRKDTEGLIFPIDLVITTIAPGAFSTLPQPDVAWKPSYHR